MHTSFFLIIHQFYLQGEQTVGLNSPEKRKLENALYEDAVMQKKCRQIEDGYDLIDAENHEST